MVINGTNAILLSTLPMKYGAAGKSSTLAGYLDFASYVGSALMTIITGSVISMWGWAAVAPLWTALFLIGGATALYNKNMHRVPGTNN
jgi:sugar phosphate permease